jgi:predicted amidohydrolase
MAKRRGLTVFLILISVITITSAFLVIAKKSGWLYDQEHIVKRLKIVSVTMQVDVDPRVNRQKMIAMLQTVRQAHPDVELVLFGETILGWYSRKPETAAYHQGIAESIPGETTTVMSSLAKEYDIYLSFGISEARDGAVYNSQVLIDPNGEIVAVHRKVNLQGSSVFRAGDILVTMADIKGIRTAVVICADIQDPKVLLRLGAEQPELILGSLANPSDPNWFVSGLIARMFDAWIVTANRYGAEDRFFFDGQMIISDPLGDLRVKIKDQEQFVYYDIGFSADRFPLVKVLRRAYLGMSLGAHFIKAVGLLFSAQ